MASTVKIENGKNVNCFVPNCSNKKIYGGYPIHFFRVPEGNEGLRWKVAVNSSRSQHNKKIGILKRIIPPSTLYCCELHFNIETNSIISIDANGSAECSIKLGICPSVKRSRSKRLWELLGGDKREQSPETDNSDSLDNDDNDLLQPLEDTEDVHSLTEEIEYEGDCVSSTEEKEPNSDSISLVDKSTLICRNFQVNSSSDQCLIDQSNEFDDQVDIKFKPMMPLTVELMKRKSLYYMGLEHGLFNRLLRIINNTTSVMTDSLVEMKIMLSLRKQRLNEEFEVLADLFDIEKSTAEQYCTESQELISSLYSLLKKLIPERGDVESLLLSKGQQSNGNDDQSSSESSEHTDQHDADNDVVTDDFRDFESSDDSMDSRTDYFFRDTVECPVCRTRVCPSRLDYHMQNIHLNPLNLNKTVCGLCFEKFRTYKLLRDHQTEVHIGASCMCDVCENMFSNVSGVKSHIRRVHMKDRPFLCHLCGASFFCSSKLRIHAQRVHSQVRAYDCKLCDKKYFQDGPLKAHILAVHKTERLFQCRFGCDKSFSRYNVRHTHEQMHKVKYSCEVCAKAFSYKHNLQTHCKNIHGRNVIDAEKCKIQI